MNFNKCTVCSVMDSGKSSVCAKCEILANTLLLVGIYNADITLLYMVPAEKCRETCIRICDKTGLDGFILEGEMYVSFNNW